MDVKQIVKQWLEQNGYDGLYAPGCCACLVTDFMPCGDACQDCEPGYKAPCDGEPNFCYGECGFHVTKDKPEDTKIKKGV